MWRSMLFLALALASTACAASGRASRPMTGAGRDVITAAEIVSSRVSDVYQAVAQLRPEFLRKRSPVAIPSYRVPQVVVYLDDLEFGPADAMRSIPLGRVRQIRYLSAMEADLRWGGRHPAGAIHVLTVK